MASGHKRYCWTKAVRVPTLTIDTNLLKEYWGSQQKAELVEKLLSLAKDGRVALAVTRRIREDIPRPPLSERLDELPELNVKETSSVTRLGKWCLGCDQLGSEAFAGFALEGTELATKRVGVRRVPDSRDWDHLHAHVQQGRDVFLTWDQGILCLANELKARFGLVVMTPEKFLDELG